MAELLTLRRYAAHRKARGLPGQSHTGVAKAIREGRLQESVTYDSKGRARINAKVADREWKRNTSEVKQRAPKVAPPTEIPEDVEQGELFPDAAASLTAPAAESPPGPQAPPIASTMAVQAVYKAQLTRLQYERTAGRLVEREAVEARAFTLGRSVSEALLQIASRVQDQLAVESDPAACHAIVDGEVRAALEALTREE